MKTKLLLTINLLTLLFLIPTNTYATHYMGGEITWECISMGQTNAGKYIFQVKLYRECYTTNGSAAAQFPNNLTLHSTSPAGSITLSEIQGWPKDISPQCNSNPNFTHLQCTGMASGNGNMGAVQEHIYRSQAIKLNGTPPTTGWLFHWESCCRNAATNINGQPSFRLRAIMYPYGTNNMYPCFDNSPTFAEVPQTVICSAYPHIINYQAWDRDLDSLSYEWGTPLLSTGSPLSPYVSGYSYQSPLPGPAQNINNVAATVNVKTGDISFTSFTTGAFVTSYKVTAYKDKVKVAEIWRDMQIVITSCGTNSQPQWSITDISGQAVTADTLIVNAGDSIVLNIKAFNNQLLPNGTQKTLNMRINGKQFGAYIPASGGTPPTLSKVTGCINPPCAILNPAPGPNLPISDSSTIQSRFVWHTDCGHVYRNNCCHVYSNTYKFSFMVKDDFCPVPANINKDIYIKVIMKKIPKIKTTNIHYNYTKLTADFSWKKYIDPDTSFIAYDIYHSNNYGGPYTLIDSIKNVNQIVYSHNIGVAQQAYYYIKLRAYSCNYVDTSDKSDILSLNIANLALPTQTQFELFQSEPNPTNGKTKIRYSIDKRAKGSFQLLDFTGRVVMEKALQSDYGSNEIILETNSFAEGVYYYRVVFGNISQTKKLIIVK